MAQIDSIHIDEIRNAKVNLEQISLAIRLTNLIGKPIEAGINNLPERYRKPISEAVQRSLKKAIEYTALTFNDRINISDNGYKLLTGLTGFGGGFFGLAGLPVELPITTILLLRAIMDIAQDNGEDIDNLETRLACMEVFAMGGKNSKADAAETGYYAVRVALSRSISEAAAYIAEKGIAEEGSPVLVRLLAAIGSRFGLVVSEKAAIEFLPVAGGIGGAAVNLLFTDHFQKAAKGHFTMRRLERLYGPDEVKSLFDSIII
jgi:hypothetical protein